MKRCMSEVLVLAVLILSLAGAAGGEEESGKTPAKTEKSKAASDGGSKFGPREVEVELRDGSKLRGELVKDEQFVLETEFGTLKVPCGEMISLHSAGARGAAVDGEALAAAIKDLGGDDPAKRALAKNLIESAGNNSLDALFEARAKAGGEAKTRIENLLKRLLLKEASSVATNDSLRTLKMTALGTLKSASIAMRTKLGELSLNLSDIAAITWLCRGAERTLELEAEAGLRDWQDTGVDLLTGQPTAVVCSGQISLGGNFATPPTGCGNWGCRPFQVGAVIGRLGEGEPFLIGNRKAWTAESAQRLYVKIFSNENMGQGNQSTGQFNLIISTGVQAGDKGQE